MYGNTAPLLDHPCTTVPNAFYLQYLNDVPLIRMHSDHNNAFKNAHKPDGNSSASLCYDKLLYILKHSDAGYNLDMTPFYTRTGDDGFTALLGEGRVPKYHPRIEAVGAVDEANAALGLARADNTSDEVNTILLEIQRDLYHLMAEVAATTENAARFRTIEMERVNWLEVVTDDFSKRVNMPKAFIVPGDSKAGAALSLSRAIVRRAERQVAQLLHSGDIENIELLRYLNRLSSLCFVLELFENQAAGKSSPTLAKEI